MSEHDTEQHRSTSGMSLEEIQKSVNGFDEIAVEQSFGYDLWTEGEARPMKFVRALVFIHLRRPADRGGQGLSDADAKARVLEMPAGEVDDYFADQDEDEPSGEGDSEPQTAPSDSLASAS